MLNYFSGELPPILKFIYFYKILGRSLQGEWSYFVYNWRKLKCWKEKLWVVEVLSSIYTSYNVQFPEWVQKSWLTEVICVSGMFLGITLQILTSRKYWMILLSNWAPITNVTVSSQCHWSCLWPQPCCLSVRSVQIPHPLSYWRIIWNEWNSSLLPT